MDKTGVVGGEYCLGQGQRYACQTPGTVVSGEPGCCGNDNAQCLARDLLQERLEIAIGASLDNADLFDQCLDS